MMKEKGVDLPVKGDMPPPPPAPMDEEQPGSMEQHMLDKTQEKQLMKQVAKGDKTAFRNLALSYQKPLTSFCMQHDEWP